MYSVLNHPGARRGPGRGLPRAPDGTRRLAVVRPGCPKGRTAGPAGRDMLVQGRETDGGDARGWAWTVEDCRRW